MAELIWAVISGVLGLACMIISICQFREKGFLFNNAYIWASKAERETMDKHPHYRQSGVVFALISVLCFVMALECILLTNWLWLVVCVLSVGVLVCAIKAPEKE